MLDLRDKLTQIITLLRYHTEEYHAAWVSWVKLAYGCTKGLSTKVEINPKVIGVPIMKIVERSSTFLCKFFKSNFKAHQFDFHSMTYFALQGTPNELTQIFTYRTFFSNFRGTDTVPNPIHTVNMTTWSNYGNFQSHMIFQLRFMSIFQKIWFNFAVSWKKKMCQEEKRSLKRIKVR